MSGTDLPSEFVDRITQAIGDPGSIAPRNGHKESTQEWSTRAVLYVLREAGYRREVDVLREAADRIDPGPASTRRTPLNDLDDMQMTCDRGVATRLRTWANVREQMQATALEQAQPLPVAARSEVESLEPVESPEGQERSEEKEHG